MPHGWLRWRAVHRRPCTLACSPSDENGSAHSAVCHDADRAVVRGMRVVGKSARGASAFLSRHDGLGRGRERTHSRPSPPGNARGGAASPRPDEGASYRRYEHLRFRPGCERARTVAPDAPLGRRAGARRRAIGAPPAPAFVESSSETLTARIHAGQRAAGERRPLLLTPPRRGAPGLSHQCRSSSDATVAGRAPTAASPASTEKLVVRRRTVRSLLMALAG